MLMFWCLIGRGILCFLFFYFLFQCAASLYCLYIKEQVTFVEADELINITAPTVPHVILSSCNTERRRLTLTTNWTLSCVFFFPDVPSRWQCVACCCVRNWTAHHVEVFSSMVTCHHQVKPQHTLKFFFYL